MQIAIEKFRNIILILVGLLIIISLILIISGKIETINVKSILESIAKKIL